MDRNSYVKIAYYYYVLGLTQDEIARRMSLTRQRVNQIVRSLADMEIVSINIRGYEHEHARLECELEERYSLTRVLVAEDYGEVETAIYKVANVAAQYLDETIRQGDVIGVSWGQTLEQIVRQMPYRKREKCTVGQLMGAYNVPDGTRSGWKSDELVRNLANRFECGAHNFYAPLVVEHEETKRWLMRERGIQASFDQMKSCDIAVIAVGAISEEATMYRRGNYTRAEMEELRADGFVAELLMNPVRADGSSEGSVFASRVMSADIDCLRGIKNTVLVACGMKKAEAITAALATGCVNTLILDRTTAERILAGE